MIRTHDGCDDNDMGRPSKNRIRKPSPQRLHRTVDVPQANRLENVRQLAAAVRDGVSHPGALLELLDVDQRHFAYYRQAALILRIIDITDDGALTVTDIGRALLATVEGSDDERARFRDAILAAPSLRPFTSYFSGQDVPLDDLAHRLGVLTGLSHSTAKRRAQTLIQWRRFITHAPAKPTGPEVPDLTGQLDRMVARHNALAKQCYLDWLLTVDPKALEELTGTLAAAMGYTDVQVVGRSGDGGVDVRAQRQDDWGHVVPCAIQVKRYSKSVGRS